MGNISFAIRSKVKNRLAPVFIRLYHSKHYDIFVDTQQKVYPQHWDAKKQRVRNIISATYREDVNNKLDELKAYIVTSVLPEAGSTINRAWVQDAIDRFYNPGGGKNIAFLDYVRKFIEQAPRRINPATNSPVSYKQIREYTRTLYYLTEFEKSERKGKKLAFGDITLDFYGDFVSYLERVNLAKNTIGKKIQTLKIFLNAATLDGLNTHAHYRSRRFATLKEESDNVYLSTVELDAIYKLDLSKNPSHDIIRDLFLIGAWTGLRFSDWNQVDPDNITKGMLQIKQRKTGSKVVIPLHPVVESILAKYGGKLPKVPTNQHLNRELKEIAKLAKLTAPIPATITRGGLEVTTTNPKWELVSTHTARRSFATNMYQMGIPPLTIAAVTSHRTESTFLKYIKVLPEEHAQKMREMWEKQTRPEMQVIKTA